MLMAGQCIAGYADEPVAESSGAARKGGGEQHHAACDERKEGARQRRRYQLRRSGSWLKEEPSIGGN